MYEFRSKFHRSFFLRVQLTISEHFLFRKWLDAGQASSHCLNQGWLVYWRIYASLGLNELGEAMPLLLLAEIMDCRCVDVKSWWWWRWWWWLWWWWWCLWWWSSSPSLHRHIILSLLKNASLTLIRRKHNIHFIHLQMRNVGKCLYFDYYLI